MRYLKALGVALVTIFALGLTATSSFATLTLPDAHILATEPYPLHLNFKDNGTTTTKLVRANGGKLEGKGVSILVLMTELSSLGTFSATFLNNKHGTVSCNTAGDATGEVLASGAFHIVPVTLSPLTDGIAFLLTKVTMKCGAENIHIEGCLLSTAETPSTTNQDVEDLGSLLLGDGLGHNTLTQYLNDNNEHVSCKLLTDVGGPLAQSAEEIGERVTLLTLESKMFTILNT